MAIGSSLASKFCFGGREKIVREALSSVVNIGQGVLDLGQGAPVGSVPGLAAATGVVTSLIKLGVAGAIISGGAVVLPQAAAIYGGVCAAVDIAGAAASMCSIGLDYCAYRFAGYRHLTSA